MQTKTYQVDRQTTSLLDISFWSNIAIIVLLAVVNFVNYARTNVGKEAIVNFASPSFVLILSVALALWLAYGCYTYLMTKKRLLLTSITLAESGVTGMALANPTTNETGINFQLQYSEIKFVGIVDVAITKKHNVLSLKLATEKQEYIIPSPQELQEIVRTISDKMTGE